MKKTLPEVEFFCPCCREAFTMPGAEFNAKKARSKTGNVFCGKECSQKFNSLTHAEKLREKKYEKN